MPKGREGKTSYHDKIKEKQAKEEKAYKERKARTYPLKGGR